MPKCSINKCATYGSFGSKDGTGARFCGAHKHAGHINLERGGTAQCTECAKNGILTWTYKLTEVCGDCEEKLGCAPFRGPGLAEYVFDFFVDACECEITNLQEPGTYAKPRLLSEVHVKTADGRTNKLDIVFLMRTHWVVVEVDEHQHKQIGYAGDRAREEAVAKQVLVDNEGLRGVVFLRFNPHNFTVNGELVTGATPGFSLAERFEMLWLWVKCSLSQRTADALSRDRADRKPFLVVHFMYYDVDARGRPLTLA